MCHDILSEMMAILYRPLGTDPNTCRACLILQRRVKAIKAACRDHQGFGFWDQVLLCVRPSSLIYKQEHWPYLLTFLSLLYRRDNNIPTPEGSHED